MYNHYIPQSDGSYRRSTVPDQNRRNQPQNNQPRPQQQQQQSPPPPQPERPIAPPQKEHRPDNTCEGESILSFLRNLLPQQIDTTDLLVVLLILLMNKDDDPNGFSPLLTLALYFLL